jgi:hypothetical protein
MAPEQARGENEQAGPAGDVFGLGGLLYFLITGKAPFEGATSEIRWRRARACDFDHAALAARGVPRALAGVVLKAMSAEPARRHASADALAADLESYLGRRRRLAIIAGLLAVALVVGFCWLIWPQPRPAAPVPLRVEALDVEVHRRAPPEALGSIGVTAFEARYEDDVRVHVRLSAPAYSYLIALNPDGLVQLCLPSRPDIAPSKLAALSFPPDAADGFGLTDGAGLQAFVVVTSRRPLPPYLAWRGDPNLFPWKTTHTTGVWRYDGESFRTDVARGSIRPLADLPQPLESACRALKARPGVDAIHSVAFPVTPLRSGTEKSESLSRRSEPRS